MNGNTAKALFSKIPVRSLSPDAYIDAYMISSGEKRIGIETVGLVLDQSEEFFFEQKTAQKIAHLKKQNKFDGRFIWVQVNDGKNILSIAKTISIRDFTKLILCEAVENKNVKAIMLLGAFAETGLEKVVNDAFDGHDFSYFNKKAGHYLGWTEEEWNESVRYNREELEALYPWGMPANL